jgi:Fe-Mn family superoxide dismutase
MGVELCAEVGDGLTERRRRIVGVFAPPLLQQRPQVSPIVTRATGDARVAVRMMRRTFIQGAGLAMTTAAMAATSGVVLAQTPSNAGARPMTYEIKPLPFDPKNIKGLSEKLLVSHYENNYSGAVRRLNTLAAQLAELDFAKTPVFTINGLKREELIAANSMILHELYFDGIGTGGTPSGALAEALARDFGSVQRWRTEFVAMGKAIGGGSGWVLLTYSPRDRRLTNQWAADHTTMLAGARPILALDMFEHSYHIDYGARSRSLCGCVHGGRPLGKSGEAV